MTASLESAPPSVQRIIEQIASAVRDGDDAALPDLLGRFAEMADLTALFALRDRLCQDMDGTAGAD